MKKDISAQYLNSNLDTMMMTGQD